MAHLILGFVGSLKLLFVLHERMMLGLIRKAVVANMV
jgi:hypothetical protein